MASRSQASALMVAVCRRLYANGFVAATDGNVSVRLAGGTILTTRTAVNKGDVTARDLVEVDMNGEPIRKGGRPSTEIGMHLFIYQERPDIAAVVHAHPPYATAFAVAGRTIPPDVFPEVIMGLGEIPLAPYATPATGEVAASLAPFVSSSDAILLANHGAVTLGRDLHDAYFKMEKLEHAALITFLARALGGEKRLRPAEVRKLQGRTGS